MSKWSEIKQKKALKRSVCKAFLVRWKGLEPPTYWFVASHSIQLSYQRKLAIFKLCSQFRSKATLCFVASHSIQLSYRRICTKLWLSAQIL